MRPRYILGILHHNKMSGNGGVYQGKTEIGAGGSYRMLFIQHDLNWHVKNIHDILHQSWPYHETCYMNDSLWDISK